MRRIRAGIALLALITAAPLQSRAALPEFVGTLTPGGPGVFWDGGYVGSDPTYSLPFVSSNSAIDRCTQVGPCFTYRLDLADTGADLRVALDTPSRDDGWEIVLTDPTGVATRRASSNQYSIEILIGNPKAGTWTISVAPYSAEYASFRMRAKLEAEPYVPPTNPDGLLLPNLRVFRMWEFGFVGPANPLNGLFPPDDVNPPLDVAGVHPLSCAPDEMVDDGAKRCLRYSFGLANVGDGYFDVRYSGDRTGARFPMTQCIEKPGSPPIAHAAGEGEFHLTHGHYHYDDIIYHQLYKVDFAHPDPDGHPTLIPAGKGKKIGYSPADQAIPEWTRFVQAPAGTSGQAGNCASGTSARLGMSRGWGDAYRYQRPGNYVEFGTNGDGYYVVQTTADPLNHLIESNEKDNTTYGYIHIVGENVDLIEVGIGQSPWDPAKEVIG